MSNTIKKHEASLMPSQLLAIAVEQGADIDKLEKLMDLQERWEQSEAKKAFNESFSAFKAESINILKNKKVSYDSKNGKTEYSHATLDHIVDTITPFLSKHGLRHSWSMKKDGNAIIVRCTLTHVRGYSEYAEFSGEPDQSGNKNPLQRNSSTVTYLERYTLLAVTGLAAKGQDDDGVSSGGVKGYLDGFNHGLNYGMACYKHKDVIEEVKDKLADNDYLAAAESLYSLSNTELQDIRRAPTKGGIFNIEETKQMQSKEFKDCVKQAIENNPGVDRSI